MHLTVNDDVLTEDWYRGTIVQMRDDLSALIGQTFVVSDSKYLKDYQYTLERWFGVKRRVRPDVVTWYPESALIMDWPDHGSEAFA